MNTPDPAFVHRNVRTLSVIGGVYDLIAIQVYEDHRELLTEAGFGSYNDIVADLRSKYGDSLPYECEVPRGERQGADAGS